jgi:hypothetical protein
MYNQAFLIYLVLMAASLYAFILCMLSFDVIEFNRRVKETMPVRFIGVFEIIIALGLISTWMPGIIGSLITGKSPTDLQHYTTLGYEAVDLGLMVPALILAAIWILQKKPAGYLLSSVMIMMSISMTGLIAILTVFQLLDGMKMPLFIALMFPVFTLITMYCLAILVRNIQEVD